MKPSDYGCTSFVPAVECVHSTVTHIHNLGTNDKQSTKATLLNKVLHKDKTRGLLDVVLILQYKLSLVGYSTDSSAIFISV